ncbi:hypothetical protein H0H93_008090 [Arthromyces matolae]|nr:hypothetical protein H0H93_008090 [Arthromyces matolae]
MDSDHDSIRLVLEAWMLPAEWLAMGGEQCNDCSTCIASEFAFAKAYPDTVDKTFKGHWETWFNQTHVDQFVELGLNTVRIPLGYWLVEDLVDRSTEYYPRGGLSQLVRFTFRGTEHIIKGTNVTANAHISANATASLSSSSQLPEIFNADVRDAISKAIPILLKLGAQLPAIDLFKFSLSSRKREPLTTNFMDVNWQYNNPSNPVDAAIGAQIYDNHLYYSGDSADLNLPGPEWALPTQFDATDDFLYKWADAQKRAYSQGAGWIFWNFKVENSELAGNLSRQWSYLDGVKLGFLTKDPSKLNDPNVCDPYITTA